MARERKRKRSASRKGAFGNQVQNILKRCDKGSTVLKEAHVQKERI